MDEKYEQIKGERDRIKNDMKRKRELSALLLRLADSNGIPYFSTDWVEDKILGIRMELWEILVPVYENDVYAGRKVEYPLLYHKEWDDMVKELTGGLTILKNAKGIWVSPEGKEYVEQMIPVRFACNDMEIVNKIIDFTMSHYEQEAIMCYKISNQVIIRYKDEK